ncbi:MULTISPECIES: hypothetical protein [Deinococcus]|uniref:hypothetical protein n=1 Tax=Deinococcus TaxID=1298 RepID=UPI00059C26F7|nr:MULTISPECIES: hypothetical protein [Deinococcus]MCY1702647.1 hypothetical protein [Deinococcus sp. SL84]
MLSAPFLDAFLMLAMLLAQFFLLALWIRAGSAVWQARGQQHPQAAPAYNTLGAALTLMPAPLLYFAVIGMLGLPRCYSVAPQVLLVLVWPELLTVVLALCAAALTGKMGVSRAVRLLHILIAA